MTIETAHIENCTLYCGDSLELLPKLRDIDAIVTDPPYGMNYQSKYKKNKHNKILNDKTINSLVWATTIKTNHSSYIFCRWDNLYQVNKPTSLITWIKNNWSMGDLNHEHARQSEVCLFYKGHNHFFPKNRPTDCVFFKRTSNSYHATEKPEELMKKVVGWTSGTVCDPFMGSGTTGVACAMMGRKFIGIEIDKKYFDIACKRIEAAYKQPDLFVEDYKPPEQVGMEL